MKKLFTFLLFLLFIQIVFSQQSGPINYFLLFDDSIRVNADTTYITTPDTLTYEQLKSIKKVEVIEQYQDGKEIRFTPYNGDLTVAGLAGNSVLDSSGTIVTEIWGTDSTKVYSVWIQFHKGKRGSIIASYVNTAGTKKSVVSSIYSK